MEKVCRFAGDLTFLGHIMLQRLEPVQQCSVGLTKRFLWNPLIRSGRQKALFQSGLLGSESDFGIPTGCLQACVAKPGANDIHLDNGFQKVHGGAVVPPHEEAPADRGTYAFSWGGT